MFRWKLLVVLGPALGLAGVGWGYAQEQKAVGFYELRIDTAQSGKREALAARFASRAAPIYGRHGITNVGDWIPQQSDPELGIGAENILIYIRSYPATEERDKRLTAAHADPEFAEVVTKRESNWATKLIVKAHNIDLAPNRAYSTISIVQ